MIYLNKKQELKQYTQAWAFTVPKKEYWSFSEREKTKRKIKKWIVGAIPQPATWPLTGRH
jgi:hypothetical protein